ncbi:MAG: hypothetical protein FJ030_13910 [Chloroflexi bacterium]|nr:hypothetical protein [Chloroflexota bacterium]
MRRWILLAGLALASCVADPAPLPQPAVPVVSPTPLPTLPYIVPTNPPLDCGPEAAIALAQTQSDLALAAAAEVDAIAQTTADSALIAQSGQKAFGLGLELMGYYDVPECLLQAKVFAVHFFEERIAAYDALAAGDDSAYDTHLNNAELARQNMVTVVNGVLGQ